MKDLLQRLWDEFGSMVERIEEIVDDVPIDEEPFLSLDNLILDTESMRQLRKELAEAGLNVKV